MKLLHILYVSTLYSMTLYAQPITVGDTGDYLTLSATQSILQPGDTVFLLGQVFDDGSQSLVNISGTASAPIVIMAKPGEMPIFRGGSQAIHLVNCRHIELNGLIIEQQTSNGINIDDGGNYETPAVHITVRNCTFRDMQASGNNDFLKMSGVDSFLVENCSFNNGSGGGSGIDMVGCHWGIIQGCEIDNAGQSGIQSKGGARFITIRRNIISNTSQRGINLGGNTSLQFFRPPLPDPIENAFEASDIDVYSNIFMDNRAPVAYASARDVTVRNNTIYSPNNWVIRILQDNNTPGFSPCQENEFSNNIIYIEEDLTEVNIGPNTAPETFIISHNLWYNASSNNWAPQLPAVDMAQLIADPNFNNAANNDFSLLPSSPAISSGNAFGEPVTDFSGMPYANPPSRGALAFDVSLPVSMVYFTAGLDKKAVKLTWQTSLEQDNDSFVVEHSSDGLNWQSIGEVFGVGNSVEVNDYSFIDNYPEAGINYYRLKQFDLNGRYMYSSVEQVWFQGQEAKIKIYPNPVSSTLSLNTGALDVVTVKIIAGDGRIVNFSTATANEVDLSGLPKGVYCVVVVTNDDQVHYLKLIK